MPKPDFILTSMLPQALIKKNLKNNKKKKNKILLYIQVMFL